MNICVMRKHGDSSGAGTGARNEHADNPESANIRKRR